ncbi:glycine--tRNA ligase [Haloquadratum walsbyi]|uniref:glycine--tRNA ligase n=1 Tax=Haloquadratum walsbyi J07HQW2 TaxID=1238425 RepID=U1NFN7_9EURY|nr:glycine--tRNA ligase [Haloquadratum walsbyi]ERG95890.1 MAG: glycyl-tRNA synthetase, dimeric type [Haloquadratum walsbyi J07HQW2]
MSTEEGQTEGERLAELAKRRGFFFGSSGAYGGVAGFYTFGPQGAALKSNVEAAWRDRFTVREGNYEIEAPTIMPEPVFEASGHLDGFDDMLVECPDCTKAHRADHLIEDTTDIEDAESLPIDEVEALIVEYDLVCPRCQSALGGEPVESFNLMFDTNIGPGSTSSGYLRPETAQGIFVEFPQIKQYARNTLPFGVTQIGRAYRNEISPRKRIVRTREFTQAELEQFIDPERDTPALDDVADVAVTLYPAQQQQNENGGYIEITVGEAVESGLIGNRWIGYFIGIAQQWYEAIGVDTNRFRFRQHLSGERAHYAAECWDAESEVDEDWIEIAGFAYRGEYDLSKHAEYGDDDFSIFQEYEESKTVERAVVDPDMSVLGPKFGAQAGDIKTALETLVERDPDAFSGDTVEIELDGDTVAVDTDDTNFHIETQTVNGEHITPHVIEPSFGIDRTVYTLLAHGYQEDTIGDENRTYLSLSPNVAPTDVGVFPLVSNVEQLVERAKDVVSDLREAGLTVISDDSGSIGRRYRRQDEVGTPFCVTVDRDGIEDEGVDTVTVRQRDTGQQIRAPITLVAELIQSVQSGEVIFENLSNTYDGVEWANKTE